MQVYVDGKLSSDTSLEDALAFLDQTKTDYAIHEQLAIVIHKVSLPIPLLLAMNHRCLAICLARREPRCRGLESSL